MSLGILTKMLLKYVYVPVTNYYIGMDLYLPLYLLCTDLLLLLITHFSLVPDCENTLRQIVCGIKTSLD